MVPTTTTIAAALKTEISSAADAITTAIATPTTVSVVKATTTAVSTAIAAVAA